MAAAKFGSYSPEIKMLRERVLIGRPVLSIRPRSAQSEEYTLSCLSQLGRSILDVN